MSTDTGASATHSFTVGDRKGKPTAAERDAAAHEAVDIEREGRRAAAQRRMSTSGEMRNYLKWRFACRAGELLIGDPFLLGSDPESAIAFLKQLDRPIRALSGGIPAAANQLLADADWLQVRTLPAGRKTLHDRIWIVGETGLLVGTSVTDLLWTAPEELPAASTATELPFADSIAWRERFERWWNPSR